MESLNLESQDVTSEDQSSVSESVDACEEKCNTDLAVTDFVSSCDSECDHSLAADKNTASLDPYSYVQRGDYTSEVYKLELMNLPKRFGIAVSLFCMDILYCFLLLFYYLCK